MSTDDTKPTKLPPSLLTLENGYRTVRTNSVEHDALVELGYVPVEQDDQRTILRRASRATDPGPKPGRSVERLQNTERHVWERLAKALEETGAVVHPEQLRWAHIQFPLLMQEATVRGER